MAALELVGRPVTSGITMKPAIAGAWQWVSDRELVFTPEAHWPVGVTYDIHVGRPAIAPQALLANDDCEIATQPFKATIADFSFQQDPVDPDGKYVFGTMRFNYPVQREALESRVVAELVDTKSGKTQPLELAVTYDDLRFEAYVKSAAIPTPVDDLTARLIVRGGVRAEAGGDAAKDPQQARNARPWPLRRLQHLRRQRHRGARREVRPRDGAHHLDRVGHRREEDRQGRPGPGSCPSTSLGKTATSP